MKFMKSFYHVASILSCALLISCSTQQTIEKEEIESIPVECNNAAKYGRSIAFLKEAGIPIASLEEYMTKPTIVTFPMKTIQAFVGVFDGNPNQTYDRILDVCALGGWVNLETNLKALIPEPTIGLKLSTTLGVK